MEKHRESDNRSLFEKLIAWFFQAALFVACAYGIMYTTQNSLVAEVNRSRSQIEVNTGRLVKLEADNTNLKEMFLEMRNENKEAHAQIMQYMGHR